MRVAILADFPLHVLPALGLPAGPKRHFATWLPPLAEAWAAPDGIDRCWIALSDSVSEMREITQWNQKFIILPTSRTGRASTLFRADRARIGEVLRRFKPDLVHGWGTEDVHALAAVTSGRPSLVSMQGIMSHYVLHTHTAWREKFQALLELYVMRRATKLTCESEWARPIVQRRAPHVEVTCVEYGVHPDFFHEAWEPDAAHPAALFVGTLTQRKGIQDVLKAYRSSTLRNMELWVAGSGPLEDKDRTFENVKWLGRLDRNHILEKMKKAWCLVLPTRADTSPNVVKEARVVGLPVLTTPCGGQSDYVIDGRNGFIIQPGAIDQLTLRLEQVLTNLPYCQSLGREGWETDRASFRPELTAQRFSRLYREMGASAAVS